MLAVGENMDNFSFPVCNAFKPSMIDGELCYMFDPSTIQSNITFGKPYLILLLDYNEDREFPAYKTDMGGNKDEPKNLYDLMENEEKKKEALIYIHTIGNFKLRQSLRKIIYFVQLA